MQELLIEPGRTEKNYWSDLWRYRELFYILAWRDICCPLQANRHRRDLGDTSSLSRHGHFYGCVWPDRQDAIQWHPLSNPGLRRNVALAVFCQLALGSQQ